MEASHLQLNLRLPTGILVDIDGTLTQLGLVQDFARLLGRPAPPREALDRYNLSELLGATPEQSRRFWGDLVSDAYRREQPHANSRELLHRLRDKGADIHYITARRMRDLEVTSTWLEQHDYPDGRLALDAHDKARLALDLGLSLAFEDSPANAIALADAGIPVILLDWPYNRHVSHPLVFRVRDWFEAERRLFPEGAVSA